MDDWSKYLNNCHGPGEMESAAPGPGQFRAVSESRSTFGVSFGVFPAASPELDMCAVDSMEIADDDGSMNLMEAAGRAGDAGQPESRYLWQLELPSPSQVDQAATFERAIDDSPLAWPETQIVPWPEDWDAAEESESAESRSRAGESPPAQRRPSRDSPDRPDDGHWNDSDLILRPGPGLRRPLEVPAQLSESPPRPRPQRRQRRPVCESDARLLVGTVTSMTGDLSHYCAGLCDSGVQVAAGLGGQLEGQRDSDSHGLARGSSHGSQTSSFPAPAVMGSGTSAAASMMPTVMQSTEAVAASGTGPGGGPGMVGQDSEHFGGHHTATATQAPAQTSLGLCGKRRRLAPLADSDVRDLALPGEPPRIREPDAVTDKQAAERRLLTSLRRSQATPSQHEQGTSTCVVVPVSNGPAGSETGTKEANNKRRRKDIRPRQGGMDGEFARMISKDLPCVSQELMLGVNEKGQQLKVEPSKNREDYISIDSRELRAVYPQKEQRDLSEIGPLLTKSIAKLADFTKLDVGEARSWLRHALNPDTGEMISLPAPRYTEGIKHVSSRRVVQETPEASQLQILEMPFSDNFTAQVCADGGTNARSYPNTSMDTMHQFCKALGLKAGKNADNCQNKYFITTCKQPGGADPNNSKLKISTADIPLPDVNAIDDLMHSAVEEKYKTELIKDSPNMRVVGRLIEELKTRNVQASIFTGADANIPKALELAAKWITPIDQDYTVDLAGSPAIPKLLKKFESMGYEIDKDTRIGLNGFKTKNQNISDELQYRVMVYDKIYETLQQPGKSKERTLDSKAHRLINPSTEGLKNRFANAAYQDHGLTRVEITFIGRWSSDVKLQIMNKSVAAVRTELVSKSIHNHIADMEIFLGGVPAVYLPETQALKAQAVRSACKKTRQAVKKRINSVPESAVMHWKTASTGKSVGRIIASDINLGKGLPAFNKTMQCLAMESPCNLEIKLYILVDGLHEYLAGGTPTLWFRCLSLKKCADSEECNKMLVSSQVCKGSGQQAETDVTKACGIHPFLLSHLRLALKKETPTYQNTGLYLLSAGTTSVVPAKMEQRSFAGRGSLEGLPERFVNVKVVEDRKGRLGRPSKTNKSTLAFEFQGDRIRIPDEYQDEVWSHYQNHREECMIRVRKSSKGFEYEIAAFCPQQNALVVSQQGKAKSDFDLPVLSVPIKILAMHRTKRYRGYSYEIELENYGRFIGPPTITKNFVQHMRSHGDIPSDLWNGERDELPRLDLTNKGYFLSHTSSARGTVKGGKGRPEEFIKIIKDNGRSRPIVVLESEGTTHARQN